MKYKYKLWIGPNLIEDKIVEGKPSINSSENSWDIIKDEEGNIIDITWQPPKWRITYEMLKEDKPTVKEDLI